MKRRKRLTELRDWLGDRTLIWFGTRGADAQSLLEFPQFRRCYSLIAALGANRLEEELCLEALRGSRVDLNDYNTDTDTSEAAKQLHRALLLACEDPSVLVAYRPAGFLTSVLYPRLDNVEYLGMFHERQTAFEHKPWVETELRRSGITVVRWEYYEDEEPGRQRLLEALADGPMVLRANRSSGGIGLRLVNDPTDLLTNWPRHRDGFIAGARYLHPNIPLNVSACVFESGHVTLHAPSLQLIGIESSSNRTFGYCGNDFARIRDLDPKWLMALEEMTLKAGRWLHKMGYRGAFGVDALVHEGIVHLAEINPRFQGSTAVAIRLAAELDMPDILTDHMAALITSGRPLADPPRRSLVELAHEQRLVAQIICYNRAAGPMRRLDDGLVDDLVPVPQLLPDARVSVEQEGMLYKLVVPAPVTNDGQSLLGDYPARIKALTAQLFAPVPA